MAGRSYLALPWDLAANIPYCQAYLKFIGIEFRTVASNNHASPTGALPFLVPSASDQSISEYGLAVPSTRLEQWACTSNLDGGTNLKHTRSVSFVRYHSRTLLRLSE